MPDRPRVAVLVDELGGGGAQRVAVVVANGLSRAGVGTMVVAACPGAYEPEVARGVPIRIVAPRWPRIDGVLRLVVGLRSVVRDDRVDMIVTNGFGVAWLALLARGIGLLRGVGIIVVEHNTMSAALRNRFPGRASRILVTRMTTLLLRGADAVIGVSTGVARDAEVVLGRPPGSVDIIRNPVDVPRIRAAIQRPVPDVLRRVFEGLERPVILTAGRLVTQKGQRDLVDAFAALPEAHRGSLVLLGEGPLRGSLLERAEEWSIADRVWMPGTVDNPWWFMARAEVFVLPSHFEGFGLVLVEAMACGARIVATDCPSGPREILADDATARLTPVAHPRALARSISDALEARDHPVVAVTLSRYEPDVVAEQYLRVIMRVHAARTG